VETPQLLCLMDCSQSEWASFIHQGGAALVGYCWASSNDGNNCSIPPTLDGWVYIVPIHGPLDGPLYIWAQYTPTISQEFSYGVGLDLLYPKEY